jgi:hypothetical protein
VIKIQLADSKVDDTPVGSGHDMAGLNVRTFLAKPDAGQKSQNNASDITVNGDYTLVGNASCFCVVDQPPVAGLAASPTSGSAPLTVAFDGSSSTDPNLADGDAVGSYTFDFGDGSSPVTQTGPTISHTYNAASSPSGYFVTLTVNDQKCGVASTNVASANIQVTGTAGVTPPPPRRPLAFRIAPTRNPAVSQLSFALDLVSDGTVRVELFSPNGRRIAELINAWMPAGAHKLLWQPLDQAGNRVPAGVYLVRAKSGERVAASRVVLLQ